MPPPDTVYPLRKRKASFFGGLRESPVQPSTGGFTATTCILFPEQAAALVGKETDLTQHDLDVLALLFQHRPPSLELGEKHLQLLPLVARNIVEHEKLPDFAQTEAEPLGSQRDLEPSTISTAENTIDMVASRVEQPLVLVVANGPGCNAKISRQLRNRKGFWHCAVQH